MEVLCEYIIDFENLNKNGFDLIGDVASQWWEVFFNGLKGPVYPALVKYFWIHTEAIDIQVSLVLCIRNFKFLRKICYQMFKKREKWMKLWLPSSKMDYIQASRIFNLSQGFVLRFSWDAFIIVLLGTLPITLKLIKNRCCII